jgi:protoheme ferro-lyase
LATAAPVDNVPPKKIKGSKGPTAMVFLNMGGPSTTDEVEDFLSRLFVSFQSHWEMIQLFTDDPVFGI